MGHSLRAAIRRPTSLREGGKSAATLGKINDNLPQDYREHQSRQEAGHHQGQTADGTGQGA